MKILFCLDVKLVKINNNFYTTGAADYNYFDHFRINKTDEMIVFCREIKAEHPYDSLAKSSGKNVKIIGVGSFKDLLNRTNRKRLKEIILNTDYHIVKQPSIIGSIACHIMRREKIKYLVDMVGCPWDASRNRSLLGKIIAPLLFLVTRYYVKNANAVMYVTNLFLQRRYPTKGIQVGCSDVILNSYDECIVKNRINKIKNLKSNRNIKIGTIGAVDVMYKGQHHVLGAMKILKERGYNIEYQLIGSGKSDYLKRIAKKNGVEDNIKFLGAKPHNEVFNWLDGIDLYVQPSEVEGLCRSVLEAMSRACPIIVSNVGGNPELIDEKYVFNNGNVRQLADKIANMTKDEMLKEAEKNFINSKNYDEKVLDEKRKKFLKEFAKLSVNNCSGSI